MKTTMKQLVDRAAKKGFKPELAKNGKTIRTYICPDCNKKRLVVFISTECRLTYRCRACPCQLD